MILHSPIQKTDITFSHSKNWYYILPFKKLILHSPIQKTDITFSHSENWYYIPPFRKLILHFPIQKTDITFTHSENWYNIPPFILPSTELTMLYRVFTLLCQFTFVRHHPVQLPLDVVQVGLEFVELVRQTGLKSVPHTGHYRLGLGLHSILTENRTNQEKFSYQSLCVAPGI